MKEPRGFALLRNYAMYSMHAIKANAFVELRYAQIERNFFCGYPN